MPEEHPKRHPPPLPLASAVVHPPIKSFNVAAHTQGGTSLAILASAVSIHSSCPMAWEDREGPALEPPADVAVQEVDVLRPQRLRAAALPEPLRDGGLGRALQEAGNIRVLRGGRRGRA